MTVRLRPEVQAFAELMEKTLRKHDRARGKSGWQREQPEWLLQRLVEETGELARALRRNQARSCVGEAIDVANFAMMIADALNGLAARDDGRKDGGT